MVAAEGRRSRSAKLHRNGRVPDAIALNLVSRSRTERVIHIVAAAGAVVAAIAAVLLGDDVEMFLVMLAAVVAGLLCFDTAMEPNWRSFTPWLFLSIAPVVRVAPVVWSDLQTEESSVDERFDHLGILLFGLCVLAAVYWVSRPARRLGRHGAIYDTVVLVGSAVTLGLAGTSVAFLYDSDFGSETVARLIESSTWTVVGALLAAIVLAASRPVRMTPALGGVLISASAATGLMAYTVSGSTVDIGWWALLFACFAISAGLFQSSDLGQRPARSRRTSAGVVVAVLMGLGAAAAAISARSDSSPAAWGPGWWTLGGASLVMLALAMASRPVEEQRLDDAAEGDTAGESAQDLVAMFGPDAGAETRLASVFGADSEAEARLASMLSTPRALSASGLDDVPQPSAEPVSPVEPVSSAEPVSPAEPVSSAEPVSPQPVSYEPTAFSAAAEVSQPAVAQPSGIVPEAENFASLIPDSNPASGAAETQQPPPSAPAAPADPVVDPIGQAHHIDPSTGLLSAAGLQHVLAEKFAAPRPGGQLTLMMFMIRDLDDIERTHGRLASAAVTRTIAQRIPRLIPHGRGARFARSAYAIILEGDQGDRKALVQHLAQVLLQLRAPIDGDHLDEGLLGERIDVVAGMAQAYAGEPAVDFVKRANFGLARAAKTVEPTLVAMP